LPAGVGNNPPDAPDLAGPRRFGHIIGGVP
jgi:hypothetical protein